MIYLAEKGLADTGYCGLNTALARQIEDTCRPDNDVFAQRVWGGRWHEFFTNDLDREFTPNDFELREPDESTALRLSQALSEMTTIAEEVMRDATLAVDAPWNNLPQRAGWMPQEQPSNPTQPAVNRSAAI